MEFIDLKSQYQNISKEINNRIASVLDNSSYIMGKEVFELEEKLGEFTKSKHVISCSSGTDALLMALMAKNVSTNDIVLTTPFTFVATGEVILRLGAVPVFVDVNQNTMNIDTGLLSKTIDALMDKDEVQFKNYLQMDKKFFQRRIKAIIAVDIFGNPCDYHEINKISSDHNISVISDCAQSFGAKHQGASSCKITEIGCTSFFPAKPLGCYGDGGAIFTDNDDLANILRSIRVHGQGEHKYENIRLGLTARLDTLQAAILLTKLEIFNDEIKSRNDIANYYINSIKLSGLPLQPQYVDARDQSVWAQFTLRCESSDIRKNLIEHCNSHGVPTQIYYPKALHLQKLFQQFKFQIGDFPVSENLSNIVFSLPMHPYLSKKSINEIIDVMANFYES